ncbi:MAG TPA: ABC transporter ATP-binding protein [Holophagaceae bacterium]|nr:ABC transporter ATP-binding protein [Holophagaceae bacterium]
MELLAAFTRRHPGGPEIRADFTIPLGRPCLTVLFGPSGCGKTTVLRALAGLDPLQEGRIAAGEELWSDGPRRLPAHRRGVGLLAQQPSLFPHLRVDANVGFGLPRLDRRARAARIAELLELVGLADLARRWPSELSGGQRQRVALARALAPRPRLLLLDEPFASLDQAGREALRSRLREALQATGTPALLVTHAREEALALADEVLLMDRGRIVQRGAPEVVFSRPAAPGLVEPGTVLRVRVLARAHGLVQVRAGAAELWAPDPGGLGETAHAILRPEGVAVERELPPHAAARNRLAARILALEPEGPLVRLRLDAGFPLEALVTAWACEDLRLEGGQSVTALVKATAIRLSPCPPETMA